LVTKRRWACSFQGTRDLKPACEVKKVFALFANLKAARFSKFAIRLSFRSTTTFTTATQPVKTDQAPSRVTLTKV
jgi:hypothetical protein